jgi:hypothetical protein
MTYLRGLGQFLYGLFIGDDWKITVGVVLSLIAGRVLLSTSLPTTAVAVLIFVLLGAVFSANLLAGRRKRS